MNWIRPFFGLLVLICGVGGGIYLWDLLDENPLDDQPQLSLLFDDVTGIEIGAKLRYRGVDVGEVRAIQLSASSELAMLSCALSPRAYSSLRSDTKFWIVRPRFNGIAQGASGLETLIKQSYITYAHSTERSPALTANAQVQGESTPPALHQGNSNKGAIIERKSPGDLILHIHIDRRSGLGAHSPIRHRGIVVGEIERVKMRTDLQAVKINARIYKNYRSLVTDKTLFWAAKAEVDVGWLSGLQVNDLDTLLSGEHLAFWTPDDDPGSPATDHANFIAQSGQPSEVDWGQVTLPKLNDNTSLSSKNGDPLARRAVVIHLSYEEDDGWVLDDSHKSSAPGILVETANGAWVVIAARSTVDPHWIDDEEKAEVTSESIRIELSNGQVFAAGRIWTHPESSDLAVLKIQDSSAFPREQHSASDELGFEPNIKKQNSISLFGFQKNSGWKRTSHSLGMDLKFANQSLQLGALVIQDNKIIGLVGTAGPKSKGLSKSRQLILLKRLPQAWRPSSTVQGQ